MTYNNRVILQFVNTCNKKRKVGVASLHEYIEFYGAAFSDVLKGFTIDFFLGASPQTPTSSMLSHGTDQLGQWPSTDNVKDALS